MGSWRQTVLTSLSAAGQLVSHASVPQQRVAQRILVRAILVQRARGFRKAARQQEAGRTSRVARLAEAAGAGGQVLEQQQLLAVRADAGLAASQLCSLRR